MIKTIKDRSGHRKLSSDRRKHREIYRDRPGPRKPWSDRPGRIKLYRNRPGHRKLWSDRHRHQEMYRDRPGHRELCTKALWRPIRRIVTESILIELIAINENSIKIGKAVLAVPSFGMRRSR